MIKSVGILRNQPRIPIILIMLSSISLNNLEIGIEYHCPHICTLFVLFENENFLLHAQLHNMFLKHIYYFKTEFLFEDGKLSPQNAASSEEIKFK